MLAGIKDRIEEYTLALTKIPSIVSSEGERNIAEFIHDKLFESQYFKENPDYLFYQHIENDKYQRKSVIALVRGTKGGYCSDTVVLLGHIDTAQ